MIRCLFARILILLCALFASAGLSPASAQSSFVKVIQVHGAIWSSTDSFVTREIDSAWKEGASGIILDLDTSSGSFEDARNIAATVATRSRDLPIAAYVHNQATGPGSLIAVACKTIAMAPGAILGDAQGNLPSKVFASFAEANNRRPAIAAAFVSADSPLPGMNVDKGGSLTLTDQQAQSVGYADLITSAYPDILAKMGQPNAGIRMVEQSTWTAIALWISQPWATILLLALGFALVIIEMLTLHSWGIAGIIGGIIIALIFAAHITVGAGTWVGLILVVAGLIFLLFETHLFPGHGISAVIGLALVCVGMYFALGGAQTGALYTVAITLITTVAIIVSFFVYLPRSRVWNKVSQQMRQTASEGYVASDDYTGFLGAIGTAVSDLRPSGAAELEGMRLPVVTEGEYITAGTSVQVVAVQGSRIVVRTQ